MQASVQAETLQTSDKELELRALALPVQARLVRITDQRSFDLAASKLRDTVTVRKAITEHHSPMKKAAAAAHKAICDAENRMLAPVAEAEAIYKAEIGAYEMAKKREMDRQIEEARKEAERIQAEERARQIESARVEAQRQMDILAAEATSRKELKAIEAQRATVVEAAVDEAKAQPLPAVRYEVQPVIYKAGGVSTIASYEAEVVSIKDLCLAVAEGRISTECVLANMPVLNRLAKAMKTTFDIPGVRIRETSTVRAKGR